MPNSTSPKPPFAPRHGALTEVAELTPEALGDDALVTDLAVTRAELAWHTSEFVEWGSCTVAGGTLADSEWYKPSLYDLELVGVDAANVRMVEAGLRRQRWRDSRLVGLDVASAVITDLHFVGCVLDLANLRFTKLTRVSFEGCRLRSVDLTGATLVDVSFEGCDLSEAQFHQAQVSRSRISGCELAGLKGVSGLRGMTIAPTDLLDLTALFAGELGIGLELA